MGISSALGSQALVPAGFGFRNLIINGDFRINQRGFSSTTSSGTYGFDRWFTQHGGGTVTASAQTFTPGNAIQGQEPTNHIRMVTTGQTATNSFGIVCQKIEDVRNGAGQTVTVSFWAKANSGTPSVTIEFEQNFGSGGSPSATVNGIGAQKVVLSTSWNRYTLTFSIPSISGKTIGTTANTSFLQLNMWVSAGSDFNSRTGSLGIQSNTFDFWGVQVELNNVPTNFEQRPIGIELHLCRRYYESSYELGTAIGTATENNCIETNYGSYTGVLYASGSYSVTKRVRPTIQVYATNNGNAGAIFVVGWGSTVYGANIGTDRIRTGVGTVTGTGIRFHYTADAEL